MAIQTKTTQKPWAELTPDEKLERRVQAWRSPPGVKFVSPEAEADYQARITRIMDAVRLKKTPDRVPVCPNLGAFVIHHNGYTQKDMMYNADAVMDVATKATLEFQLDMKIVPGEQSGKVMEMLGIKNYLWPGHGMPDDGERQFIEGEFMKADEYDAYLEDPSDFQWRTYLPRIWEAAEPLAKLMPLSQLNQANVARFAAPEIQAAFHRLGEAGKAAQAWQQKTGPIARKLSELGFPTMLGPNPGFGGAVFDALGDSLRGTRAIVWDMFRQPDKLLNAMDAMVQKRLRAGHREAESTLGQSPIITMPLHKGADGFMSDEHFRKFYWPQLRTIIFGMVEEGLIPRLRAQGGYNARLDIIRDIPKGKVIWAFDYTDMAKAKEVLGNVCCIMGNMPAALLHSGTVEQVKTHTKYLIDACRKDGGYIFDTGAGLDAHANADNVHAMLKCAKEYGVYR